MLNKAETKEMIQFYLDEMKTLTLEQQKQVTAIVTALRHVTMTAGKQGVIAAGIFSFEVLLGHIDGHEPEPEVESK